SIASFLPSPDTFPETPEFPTIFLAETLRAVWSLPAPGTRAGRQELPAPRPRFPQSGAVLHRRSACGLQSASAPARVAALRSSPAKIPGTQTPHSAIPTPTELSAAPKAREWEPRKCG